MNYNGSVSIENGVRFTEHMSADEYRNLIGNLGTGTDFGGNTDWYDEITRTAISHQQNLSFLVVMIIPLITPPLITETIRE